MVEGLNPGTVKGFVVAAIIVPCPGVKPARPYSISHKVAPPLVQLKSMEVAVAFEVTIFYGLEQAGFSSIDKSSMAISAAMLTPTAFNAINSTLMVSPANAIKSITASNQGSAEALC